MVVPTVAVLPLVPLVLVQPALMPPMVLPFLP
jgi:hypothetical protein